MFLRPTSIIALVGLVSLPSHTWGEEEGGAPPPAPDLAEEAVESGDDNAEEDEKTSDAGKNVSIRGLRSFGVPEARGMIENQLLYIDQNGVSKARADDAAFLLESALRDRGFESARVDWELPSPQQAVLVVNEGKLIVLSGINSVGNEAISDEGIFELMTSETRDRLAITMEDQIPFVKGDVEAGRNHVKEYYELLGYVGAKVTLSVPVVGGGASIKPTLTVEEGKIYKVGTLEIGDPPDPSLAEQFEKIRDDYLDQNFSPAFASQVAVRLKQAAVESGYLDADVKVKALTPIDDGDFRKVDLETTADYGERYRVRSLQVEGTEKVKNRVFDHLFEDVVGEPYDPEAANKVVNKMLRTGAFQRVTALPNVVEGEPALVDLAIDVQESKRQEVGAIIGFGTYDGPIVGMSYRHLNMLGKAHRFDSKIVYTGRGISGEIDYLDPWLFWSDWTAKIGLFSRTRDNEGYNKLEGGIRGELRREYGERQVLTIFGQTGYASITEDGIEQPFLGDEKYFDSYIGGSYELSNLDNKAAPRDGFLIRASSSFATTALGGDYDYIRSTLTANYHFPLGPTTFHFRAKGGLIYHIADDGETLPIDLRFFSGGFTTVRSFPDRELGAKMNGFPIGGEFFTAFTAEYQIPIVGPLSLALFGDAGNLIFDSRDAGLEDMHYAAGAGLRVDSPIGPLRVDYGYNLNRGRNEPSGTFHVGFGVAF